MGKNKNENTNTNKNKNVININIDTKKKRSKKKTGKKRGNNIGASLSYPASTTTNNYITTNTYPYNGYIPQSAPGILNRHQILDNTTATGNEILQQEQKEIKEHNFKSTKDKMMAQRIAKFNVLGNGDDSKQEITPAVSLPFQDPTLNVKPGQFTLSLGEDDGPTIAHSALFSMINPKKGKKPFRGQFEENSEDEEEKEHKMLSQTDRTIKYENIVNSSRESKRKFTTPKPIPPLSMPPNIADAENEGELSGDIRATDTPIPKINIGTDGLDNDAYS